MTIAAEWCRERTFDAPPLAQALCELVRPKAVTFRPFGYGQRFAAKLDAMIGRTIATRFFSRGVDGDVESLFNRPATFDALEQGHVFHAERFGPLSDGGCFAVEREPVIFSRVSGLFFRRSPTAVFPAVAFRAVDTVKGVVRRWSWSHVGHKCLTGLLPAFADSDWVARSAAVQFPVFERGIDASSQHGFPRMVERVPLVEGFKPHRLHASDCITNKDRSKRCLSAAY